MSFYDKLEFTETGRLKRGEMKKLTDAEKHQYYLDYNKKYYSKQKPYEVRKNKKVENGGKLITNSEFIANASSRSLKIKEKSTLQIPCN